MLSDEEKKAIEDLIEEIAILKENSEMIIDSKELLKYKETLLNLIKKQSKEIEELKEENKKLTDEYLVQRDLINPDFLKDYINKDKIKAKIKEISKEWAEGELDGEWYEFMKYHLQSLLEKE